MSKWGTVWYGGRAGDEFQVQFDLDTESKAEIARIFADSKVEGDDHIIDKADKGKFVSTQAPAPDAPSQSAIGDRDKQLAITDISRSQLLQTSTPGEEHPGTSNTAKTTNTANREVEPQTANTAKVSSSSTKLPTVTASVAGATDFPSLSHVTSSETQIRTSSLGAADDGEGSLSLPSVKKRPSNCGSKSQGARPTHQRLDEYDSA